MILFGLARPRLQGSGLLSVETVRLTLTSLLSLNQSLNDIMTGACVCGLVGDGFNGGFAGARVRPLRIDHVHSGISIEEKHREEISRTADTTNDLLN